MSLIRIIKRLLRQAGLDVIRYNTRSSPVARRIQLFAHYDINLVFDVGANTGGYALELRRQGYKGRIVSFEPLSSAFADLDRRASRDSKWEAIHTALGAHNDTVTIHIAQNSESSSILDMLPRHEEAFPHSVYVDEEEIKVQTLDSIFDDYYQPGDRIYLKMDTQGYEQHVLEGASASLDRITGLQLEMSLVPLYAGERLFADMVNHLQTLGFVLMSIEPTIDDPRTGQLLQIDGLFFRERA